MNSSLFSLSPRSGRRNSFWKPLVIGLLSLGCGRHAMAEDLPWVLDALPPGASGGAEGGDGWNWTSNNPIPFSGTLEHTSNLGAGLHQHYFSSARATLSIHTGDSLFTYVYLDPINPPSEVMLQWNDGTSWEHRAYWGANEITYGTNASAGRFFAGPLPAAGQWVRLQVAAGAVALEGSTVSGMAFTLYDGHATWDDAGQSVPTENPTAPVVVNLPSTLMNVNSKTLRMPKVGDSALNILSPTLLELQFINTEAQGAVGVTNWNFVNTSGELQTPAPTEFAVTVNGQAVAVQAVGFKRRPLYAPLLNYDLRIENSLYLQLASPISDNQAVAVMNPDATLWTASTLFTNLSDPLRFNPAIHVNQEGYVPSFPKKAVIGYYLGSLDEMNISTNSGFTLVEAITGAQVYQGSLTLRQDVGYLYMPTPYQQVLEADFSGFTNTGAYLLAVPGLGASLPFQINDGVAMAFTRAYALGLYGQRCGTSNSFPFTRFVHDACHTAPVSVPSPQSNSAFNFTWKTISNYAATINSDNPPQIAPLLTNEAAQLYPFVNKGAIDVSGGHHDAGDYSKYTINCATLIHTLMFAVDSLPGVAGMDNLGIPESGDGISDVMQEAKWEADYLTKIQDADGGFYFLVYPIDEEYESNVLPENGSAQVVWPKNTAVTAAAVAALAECASSPNFKRHYPAAAALYMQKAQLGWQFLTNAIARYGKAGAYQKLTFYGDDFTHDDELAWAACAMFVATGDPSYQQTLLSWFDPSDPATWRWGWWHMYSSYGNAIRTFAFAARSGRLSASQLDPVFLAKCQAEILAAGNDALAWSQQNAYGSSFPEETKAVLSAGWYFSSDQAFDITVAYQLNPLPAYLDAILRNMNYEGGCNPVNITYVTGLGWKRQREIVSQYAQNDRRVLPPDGIPLGNIQTGFVFVNTYGDALASLCFPSDSAVTAPQPFYDRWGDAFNVTTEFVGVDQARSLASLAYIATLTTTSTQAWTSVNAQIVAPTNIVPVGAPVTVTLQVPGMDTTGARVVWEARDQEPAYGSTFTFAPVNNGVQWIEAEAQWPDGRRAFATVNISANSPVITWLDGSLPTGAVEGADGGDSWTWTNGNPPTVDGSLAVESASAAGEHEHFFSGATATLQINIGDILFAYVYLDPSNPPTEVMLQWNDGSSWEHRAYWGADNVTDGAEGTMSRYDAGPLPALGQWVELEVSASAVGLEDTNVAGMAFTLYGGDAMWGTAGKISPSVAFPIVAINSPINNATVSGPKVTVSASASAPVGFVAVQFELDGASLGAEITNASCSLTLNSTSLSNGVHTLTAIAQNSAGYQSTAEPVTFVVNNNPTPVMSITPSAGGMTITWLSSTGQTYYVAAKANLSDANWINLSGNISATNLSTSWTDHAMGAFPRRFYVVIGAN